MKLLQWAVLAGCVVFLSSASAINLPVFFHAGRLDNLTRITDPVKFIRKDEALKQNRLVPTEDDGNLLEERSPEDDQVFIVLSVSVYPGRSIGPSDYVLQVDAREYPCLGMASARNHFYDFRMLEAKGPAEVLLIFSCPAAARGASLKSTHADLPIPTITGLVLQEPEPEPEPEPTPPAETKPTEETPAAEKAESEKAATAEPEL
ncbi:MAG: hypothetical protein GX927_12605 [Lentisphaerae bacterium]|jgi:hypothetical protein|nr:hypothetical protein [Lentisphaerota bacterium]